MGFSMESIVAIPCCLTILTQTVGLAFPLSRDAKNSADINAWMATIENSQGYTCHYERVLREGWSIPYVKTCPQKMVESLSLTHDLISTIKSHVVHEPESDS